jgi:hypothetical protein
MRHNLKKDTAVIVFFIIFVAVIFRQYIFLGKIPFPSNLQSVFYMPWAAYPKEGYPLGPTTKGIGFDNIRMFYPIRKLVIDDFKIGKIPLWNPYSFSGNTLLGTHQSAVFFPFAFLFFILPMIDAWSVITIMAPILTLLFTYLLLRELGISRLSSVFGAIGYAFSGIMIGWWEEMFLSVYSMLFCPLILWAIHNYFRTKSWKTYAVLVTALSGSVLSGWFQATLYTWGFSVIFAVTLAFIGGKKCIKPFVVIASAYVNSILICAIQLIPSFEAYIYSARHSFDTALLFKNFFAPLTHIVTLIAPDFFGNPAVYNYFGGGFYHEKAVWVTLPTVLLFLYECLYWKKREPTKLFFKLSTIIILSLGFALPTSWFFLYTLHLPFLFEMTPSRIFFLSSLCLSISSAYGLDRYNANRKSIFIVIPVGLLLLAFSITWYYVRFLLPIYDVHYGISLRNMVIPTILFIISGLLFVSGIFNFHKRKYISIFLIIVSLASVLYVTNKYLYFSERKFVFPDTPIINKLSHITGINRVWSIGKGAIVRNILNYYKIQSPEGYESFNIARYNELVYASHTQGKYTPDVQRADVEIYKANTYEDLLTDDLRKRVLKVTGVKYIVGLHAKDDMIQKLSEDGFVRIWTDQIYDIFEYVRTLPRYYLVSNYIKESDNQKIINLMYSPMIDLSKTIILEETPQHFEIAPEATGEARLISYQSDKVDFMTKTNGNMLLYISDNYFPGWLAFIDGNSSLLYRANYAFRAVPVPSGEHKIEFIYKPKSFVYGVIVSVVGIIIFISSCVYLALLSKINHSLS